MKIRRTIPPAAAPLGIADLVHGMAGLVSGGRHRRSLAAGLQEYFDVRHTVLLNSGKSALFVILRALSSLAPGRPEVVIPAYTCFSVPSAVVKAGLAITPCDLDPGSFDFDPAQLEHLVTEKTLCVLPDHLFGIPSRLEPVAELCRKRGAFLVEDAAQAMGGTLRGKKLGTAGDAAFFSFGRGKNITCGSGGVIVTNSDRIAQAIEREYAQLPEPSLRESIGELAKVVLLACFIRPSFYWLPAGLPFLKLGETFFYRDFPVKRLSGMQAGLLRNWRERLEHSNSMRRQNASYFCNALKSLVAASPDHPLLRLPILLKTRALRDAVFSASTEQGLGLARMYPGPVNTIPEISGQFSGRVFPNASRIAETLLTLPVHPLLTAQDLKSIAEFVKKNLTESSEKNDRIPASL